MGKKWSGLGVSSHAHQKWLDQQDKKAFESNQPSFKSLAVDLGSGDTTVVYPAANIHDETVWVVPPDPAPMKVNWMNIKFLDANGNEMDPLNYNPCGEILLIKKTPEQQLAIAEAQINQLEAQNQALHKGLQDLQLQKWQLEKKITQLEQKLSNYEYNPLNDPAYGASGIAAGLFSPHLQKKEQEIFGAFGKSYEEFKTFVGTEVSVPPISPADKTGMVVPPEVAKSIEGLINQFNKHNTSPVGGPTKPPVPAVVIQEQEDEMAKKKAKAKPAAVYQWRFESSKEVAGIQAMYITQLRSDGSLGCNCPGWIFKKKGQAERFCKHTKNVEVESRDLFKKWKKGETLPTIQDTVALKDTNGSLIAGVHKMGGGTSIKYGRSGLDD